MAQIQDLPRPNNPSGAKRSSTMLDVNRDVAAAARLAQALERIERLCGMSRSRDYQSILEIAADALAEYRWRRDAATAALT